MRALPWRQRPHSCLESMGLWADTRTRPIYRKGLRPQGLGLPYFFSPAPNRSPGASGPLVVWTAVQEIPYPPVFLKRKPANFLGDRGQSPRRLFASFLHAEKGCGRAFDFLFSKIAFFLRGRPAIPVFSGLACGPPPFLATRKGEKNRQGGLCRFSLYEDRLEPYCQNQPI